MIHVVTLPKESDNYVNEDFIKKMPSGICVSDGAGGGGIFAELWSQYLVENLPAEPIQSSEELENWLSRIWEPFFVKCELMARERGALALDKFYNEGSFATLASVWINEKSQRCFWTSYGDSVVFHYRMTSRMLFSSIESLDSFNNQPFLINFNKPIIPMGYSGGEFALFSDSIVMVCSDAMAHYILLMYYLNNKNEYSEIISKSLQSGTKNSLITKVALNSRIPKFEKVLEKLMSSSKNRANFRRHTEALKRKGFLSSDDYSFGFFTL